MTNPKKITIGVSKTEVWSDETKQWEDIPKLMKPPTIMFVDIKIGTRFMVDGIIHKKVSQTATYGYSAKDNKLKKGIYTFHPKAELIIINNNDHDK